MKKESKNVDYFNIDFKCGFPLSLILNKKNLDKYQVLFRYIFWCKFIERQLNSIWLDLQATKMTSLLIFKKANLLTQKMLNFIKSLIYYLSYEVIEKNWRNFELNLAKINNFEDILNYHNQFLLTCLQESLLVNSKLLPIITNDLGASCQGFLDIKRYVEIFNPENINFVTQILYSVCRPKGFYSYPTIEKTKGNLTLFSKIPWRGVRKVHHQL